MATHIVTRILVLALVIDEISLYFVYSFAGVLIFLLV
jgi:hypothetical protein